MKRKLPFAVLSAALVVPTLIAPIQGFADTTTTKAESGLYFTSTTAGEQGAYYSFEDWAALTTVEKGLLLAKYGTENVQVYLDSLNKITTLKVISDSGKPFLQAAVDFKETDIAGEFKNGKTGEVITIGEQTPAPGEELTVESVSAINKTTVTVTFTALTEVQEDVVFEVKDNNGNVVEVKPVAVLDVGETTTTITFKTPLTADPTGTWSVNGVNYDANTQVAVKAVNDATNQITLLAALKSPYFKNVTDANLVAYATAMLAPVYTTVAEVQKAIDDANVSTTGTAAVKAVVDALIPATPNQVELLTALQDSNFVRVNPDWINDYATDGPMNALTTSSTVPQVQTAIDNANATKITNAINAVTGLDKTKLADARELVEAYELNNTDVEKAAKAAKVKTLDIADAVIKVNDAQTKASVKTALTNLAALDSSLTVKINDTLLSDYIAAIKVARDVAATDVDTTSKINTILGTVLTTKTATAIKGLKDLAADANDATVNEAFQYLADVTATAVAKFDIKTINDALLSEYRDAVIGQTMADVAAVNSLITPVNSPTNAISDITSAADETDLLDALKAKTLNLKNVNDANKDAYFYAPLNKNVVSYFTKVTTPAEAQKTVNAVNAFVDANNATLATQLNSALNSFVAIISDDFFDVAEASNYINLSSAAKLEVAEIVLNAKQADYSDAMELAVAIDTAVTAYTGFLGDVNGATTISGMNTNLDKASFPAFQELNAAEKVEKAEAVLAKLTELKAQDPATNFKTIAQIKAAAGL